MVDVNKPMRAEKLTAVKGMNDVLAPESSSWEVVEGKVRMLMARTRIADPHADCGAHGFVCARIG